MARLLSVSTLPAGKLPPFGTNFPLYWSESGCLSMAFLSPYPLWSEITNQAEAKHSQALVIYHRWSWLHAGDKMKTFASTESHPHPTAPNFILGKTPGNNEIWCCNIKVVEKAVFQWCYLSCSVPTPCNDDLSLFSVLCSIFIYDQASFTFFFLHSIPLDLSSIFFVPYLQLMKK